MNISVFYSSNQYDIGAGIEANKWGRYYSEIGLDVFECVGEDFRGSPGSFSRNIFILFFLGDFLFFFLENLNYRPRIQHAIHQEHCFVFYISSALILSRKQLL